MTVPSARSLAQGLLGDTATRILSSTSPFDEAQKAGDVLGLSFGGSRPGSRISHKGRRAAAGQRAGPSWSTHLVSPEERRPCSTPISGWRRRDPERRLSGARRGCTLVAPVPRHPRRRRAVAAVWRLARGSSAGPSRTGWRCEVTERRRLSARFPKRSSRGVLLGFSGPRVGALGAAALVALVGVLAFGAAGLVLVVVWLPIALSAFVRIGGQPAVEWFPTWVHFAGRRHVGQTEYRSRLPVQARPLRV